ncbi:ATP-binding protein [Streptomyces monomycini]|uniref:ATP-binding protein n=1 Tax=Streptomyces monomycini TaxID=371720 RepID=UPI0005180B0E|nr:ATP-binding protein [Streptomyces monomycini]
MPVSQLVHEDKLDYTPTARSVSLARRRAARLVAEWGQAEAAGDAALIVSELATNALLHGSLRGRLFRVRLVMGPSLLRIEVSDPRGERVPRRRRGVASTSGHGLVLVGGLADRWGIEPRTVGKTVWAEVELGVRASTVRRSCGPARSGG